jgi:hypothetical protein
MPTVPPIEWPIQRLGGRLPDHRRRRQAGDQDHVGTLAAHLNGEAVGVIGGGGEHRARGEEGGGEHARAQEVAAVHGGRSPILTLYFKVSDTVRLGKL